MKCVGLHITCWRANNTISTTADSQEQLCKSLRCGAIAPWQQWPPSLLTHLPGMRATDIRHLFLSGGGALAVAPPDLFFNAEEIHMDLPQQQTMTPEQAYERLQAWFMEKSALAAAKSHEHLERVALSSFYFTAPVEGTNRLDLGGGFDLKLVHKYNVSVDEAELDNVKAADIKKLKLPWDDLFVYKPTLAKSVYNELTTEQKKFVDQLLDIKPASPDLAIVPSADRAGQQAHVEKAEAQYSPTYVIAPEAEKAKPGDFYNDGATWWQLNEEIEWDEVTSVATVEALNASAAALNEASTPAKPKRSGGRRKASAK